MGDLGSLKNQKFRFFVTISLKKTKDQEKVMQRVESSKKLRFSIFFLLEVAFEEFSIVQAITSQLK